jgi:hypothetical protein
MTSTIRCVDWPGIMETTRTSTIRYVVTVVCSGDYSVEMSWLWWTNGDHFHSNHRRCSDCHGIMETNSSSTTREVMPFMEFWRSLPYQPPEMSWLSWKYGDRFHHSHQTRRDCHRTMETKPTPTAKMAWLWMIKRTIPSSTSRDGMTVNDNEDHPFINQQRWHDCEWLWGPSLHQLAWLWMMAWLWQKYGGHPYGGQKGKT